MYTYNIYTYVFTFKDAVSRSLSSLLSCTFLSVAAALYVPRLFIPCLLTQGRGFAILVLPTFSHFTFLLPRALRLGIYLLMFALFSRMPGPSLRSCTLLLVFTCCPALYAPWLCFCFTLRILLSCAVVLALALTFCMYSSLPCCCVSCICLVRACILSLSHAPFPTCVY